MSRRTVQTGVNENDNYENNNGSAENESRLKNDVESPKSTSALGK
jgi:hypothetical protein